jgi:predicted DNA-binding transcriptional regulator AlpA
VSIAESELLGPVEVAKLLGVSKQWVYSTFTCESKGGIKPLKIGHLSRWYRRDVLAWIEARYAER